MKRRMIKHGKLFTIANGVLENGDILIEDGKIAAVDRGLPVPEGTEVIDAAGTYVTPGLIDTHAHIGLDEWGNWYDINELNEIGDPITPQLRGVDGFYCRDRAIGQAAAAGITSIIVHTGSIQLFSGQSFAFKTKQNVSLNDMLIDSCIGIKGGFGGTPKRFYDSVGGYPATRMGGAYVLRKTLADACAYRDGLLAEKKELLAAERKELRTAARKGGLLAGKSGELAGEDWDPEKGMLPTGKHGLPDSSHHLSGSRYDLLDGTHDLSGGIRRTWDEEEKLKALQPLVNGTIPWRVHVYKLYDIVTCLRIAKEFGIRVVLEHGGESPLIAEQLAEMGVYVTVGPSAFIGSVKPETFYSVMDNVGRFIDAGVTFGFQSDHPIIHTASLPTAVGMYVRKGLPEDKALEALTLSGAKIIGFEDRLGSIEVGKDADLVIASGSVFDPATVIHRVLIDGEDAV